MEFNSEEFINYAKLLVREVENYKNLSKGINEADDADVVDGMAYEMQDTYQTILSVKSSLLEMLGNF